jgi:glycerol-3-phosphate acyltransferase PlsY
VNNDVVTWQAILLLVGAYLLGSIPSAYLAGRWIKGIDVREYGSGNVGGSNVWHSVARWAIVPVAIFDIGKAVLMTWLTMYTLEWGVGLAFMAGLCVAIGHAWSIFLGFSGGRGLSCVVGTLVVVFPIGCLVLVIGVFLGYLLKNTAGTTIGMLLLPVVSLTMGELAAVTLGCLGIILFTALKRLEGNRRPLPQGKDRWPVIWRRRLLDRDIADHKEWLKRRPGS